MPYPDDQDDKRLVLNLVHDSVLANADSPQSFQLTLQGCSLERILGESVNRVDDPRADLSVDSLQVPYRAPLNLD